MANILYNLPVVKSLKQKFREKRFQFFLDMLEKVGNDRTIRILDIGGTQLFWEKMNFLDKRNIHITLLNLQKYETKNKNFTSIIGDATNLSQFKDKEFDIVFSNSVIEHLYTIENQKKMANEARRVGKCYFIQTPNHYFPVEPHWLFPFFQFLPKKTRIYLTSHFPLGSFPKAPSKEQAARWVNEVRLLTGKEMKALFPEGKVYNERFLGMTKSITMYYFHEKAGGTISDVTKKSGDRIPDASTTIQ